MAVLGALDVAWILRLSGWPAGPRAALAGVVATAAIIALANWWIIAAHLGAVLGFDPLESALRLGVAPRVDCWCSWRTAPFDLAMIAVALRAWRHSLSR